MDVSVAKELITIELTWDEALILDMAIDSRRDAVAHSVAELRFLMTREDAEPLNERHSMWTISINMIQQKLNMARMNARQG